MHKLNESYNSKIIRNLLNNNTSLKYLRGEYSSNIFRYNEDIAKYPNSNNIMDKIVNILTSLFPLYEQLISKEITNKLKYEIKYNRITQNTGIDNIYIDALEKQEFNNIDKNQVYLIVNNINKIFKQLDILITKLYKGDFTGSIESLPELKLLQNINDNNITPIYKDNIKYDSMQSLYNNIKSHKNILILTYDDKFILYKSRDNEYADIVKYNITTNLSDSIINKITKLYNFWKDYKNNIKYIQYKNINIPYLDNPYYKKIKECIGDVILYMFVIIDTDIDRYNYFFYEDLLNISTKNNIIGYNIELPKYNKDYVYNADKNNDKILYYNDISIPIKQVYDMIYNISNNLSRIMSNSNIDKTLHHVYYHLDKLLLNFVDFIKYPVNYEPNNINQMLLFTRYEQFIKTQVYQTLQEISKYINNNQNNTDKAKNFTNIINKYIQQCEDYFEKIKDVTSIKYHKSYNGW